MNNNRDDVNKANLPMKRQQSNSRINHHDNSSVNSNNSTTATVNSTGHHLPVEFAPTITYEQVVACFHLPLHEASILLKADELVLKRHCRYYGIKGFVIEKNKNYINSYVRIS